MKYVSKCCTLIYILLNISSIRDPSKIFHMTMMLFFIKWNSPGYIEIRSNSPGIISYYLKVFLYADSIKHCDLISLIEFEYIFSSSSSTPCFW